MGVYDMKAVLYRDEITGYAMTSSVIEQVYQKFKLLLMTAPGERINLPEMGVNLRRFLFEDNIRGTHSPVFDEMTATINEQVEQYMPYIIIRDITFEQHELSPNGIIMRIIFKIAGLQEEDHDLTLWTEEGFKVKAEYLAAPSDHDLDWAQSPAGADFMDKIKRRNNHPIGNLP